MKYTLCSVEEPTLYLNDIGKIVKTTNSFYVYGTGGLGFKVKKLLENLGKDVLGFLGEGDDQHSLSDEKNVYKIEDINITNEIIVIASYHAMEIAHHLREKTGLEYGRHYLFFNHLVLSLKNPDAYDFGKGFYTFLKQNKSEFEKVMSLLDDEASKDTYWKIINYRVNLFNPERIVLEDLPTPPSIQKEYESNAATYEKQLPDTISEGLKKGIAFKISQNSYSYLDVVTPKQQKVIFDIGSYNNTPGMFSYLAPDAKVYAFEPQHEAYQDLIELSQTYDNIHPVQAGAWNKTGKVSFNIDDTIYGATTTSAIRKDGKDTIDVFSIDDFVALNDISTVDYIKMDIEGSEEEALEGAHKTILEYKPRLAISIDHKPEHLYRIPLSIKEKYGFYKIYIGHRYYHATKSVCFAVAKDGA